LAAVQRASISKLQLEAIEQLPQSHEILATVPERVLQEIREASRTAWVSTEYMATLLAAVHRVGGGTLVRVAAHSVVIKTTKYPLFQPLLLGTLRVFGNGPAALFRALHVAWGHTNRNVGELQITVEKGSALVTVTDLAPALDIPAFKLSWEGTVGGILSLANVEGRTTVVLNPGGFEVHATW
jgi:hypothetical protein